MDDEPQPVCVFCDHVMTCEHCGIEQPYDDVSVLKAQLERANRIIGWMMPYIGNMCPPENGLSDLNIHCCENVVPEPACETKGRPINQQPSN